MISCFQASIGHLLTLFISSQVLSQGGLGPTLSWSLANEAESLGNPSHKGGYSITTFKYRAKYKDFGKRLTCAISNHRYWNNSGKNASCFIFFMGKIC